MLQVSNMVHVMISQAKEETHTFNDVRKGMF